MRGNTVSYGHTRLIEWADRHTSFGFSAINTVGRFFEEGAGAACQSSGQHGDPTMACQLRDEDEHDCQSAVDALKAQDECQWAAVMAHYLHGWKPVQIATGLGVEPRRGRDLLECGQSWVGARLMEVDAKKQKDRKSQERADFAATG